METPHYLQILWAYKWLVLIGVVVAAAAALLAGFTISNGQIVSRAQGTYSAATTVMLESQQPTLFQSEIAGQALSPTAAPPQAQNLSASAVLYAYLASSDQIKKQVESVIGNFSDTDALTAVSRTTQPAGSELFPGRLQLPVIDIVGTAATPARASAIARTADVQFRDYVTAQQKKANIPDANRVSLATLQVKPPVQAAGSNPAIPVVVAGAGVFLAFIALIFIIHGARTSRNEKRAQTRAGRRRRGSSGELEESAIDDPELIDRELAGEHEDTRIRVSADE